MAQMKISDLIQMSELLTKLLPHQDYKSLSVADIKRIEKETSDRAGEFVVRLKPSNVIQLMETEKLLREQIQSAQLDGKEFV